MVDKFYVPYLEDSASDWSPNCVVKYEDYAALRKVASMLMENLSDDTELPHETVELMMDLGVFDV